MALRYTRYDLLGGDLKWFGEFQKVGGYCACNAKLGRGILQALALAGHHWSFSLRGIDGLG